MTLHLWAEFFDELVNIRGRSKNTVLACRRDLELYCEYLEKSQSISGFFEFMRKRKLSTRSQARVISSLRTYYRFLESKGIEAPQLRELRPPRVKVNLPQAITFETFKTLMESCEHTNNHRTERNQMVLLLLFGVGCRVSELITLDLSDFHETDGWLSITGKGGKQRVVPLTAKLILDLKHYLIEVRPHLITQKTNSIIINDRGNRPSRIDMWRWLAAWSKKAGFEDPISPHKFRHGCATALLESGADLRSIQLLLGHSSIQTTQVYTSVTTQTKQKAIDEFHPLSGLKELE